MFWIGYSKSTRGWCTIKEWPLKGEEQGRAPGPGTVPPGQGLGPGGGKGKGKGGPGGAPAFGKDNFYISILGAPSRTEPWMLQFFGGHHLALNVTFAGAHGVLTPSLTAALRLMCARFFASQAQRRLVVSVK